ncbi:MAG TPA: hypothetical protein VF230_04295 [Acidimicrobiales bacterium]
MRRVLLSAVLAAGLLGVISSQAVNATHEPADKVSASGSAGIVVSPGSNVTLMSERIRTSSPSDLILGVTAECVITTELTTVGNDLETAEAQVRIWIEVDGVVVPVSADDTADPGKVTFCDRLDERETTVFDDEDATIRTLQRTGNANGFNWLKLNTGSGIHTIEVKADLTHAATDGADALAAVGKRTLIIEPVKAANDETITQLG